MLKISCGLLVTGALSMLLATTHTAATAKPASHPCFLAEAEETASLRYRLGVGLMAAAVSQVVVV